MTPLICITVSCTMAVVIFKNNIPGAPERYFEQNGANKTPTFLGPRRGREDLDEDLNHLEMLFVLLMEEILHHLGWLKPYK